MIISRWLLSTTGRCQHQRYGLFVFHRKCDTAHIVFSRIRNIAYRRDKQSVSRTDLSPLIRITDLSLNRACCLAQAEGDLISANNDDEWDLLTLAFRKNADKSLQQSSVEILVWSCNLLSVRSSHSWSPSSEELLTSSSSQMSRSLFESPLPSNTHGYCPSVITSERSSVSFDTRVSSMQLKNSCSHADVCDITCSRWPLDSGSGFLVDIRNCNNVLKASVRRCSLCRRFFLSKRVLCWWSQWYSRFCCTTCPYIENQQWRRRRWSEEAYIEMQNKGKQIVRCYWYHSIRKKENANLNISLCSLDPQRKRDKPRISSTESFATLDPVSNRHSLQRACQYARSQMD